MLKLFGINLRIEKGKGRQNGHTQPVIIKWYIAKAVMLLPHQLSRVVIRFTLRCSSFAVVELLEPKIKLHFVTMDALNSDEPHR